MKAPFSMPCSSFAPSIYFDDSDLDALAREFSERIRADSTLRPVLDRLVGNRWEDAELAITDFLHASLFLQSHPQIDEDWLTRAAHDLNLATLDRLGDILLDCALVALPLHSAAVIAEISDALACLLGDVVSLEDADRKRRLPYLYDRLRSGALMNRL
ncbi:hypothetical protein VQ042_25540 [Aurantimonas sp. A2-1-M11]|uniref:hypothetical protein n=1 Tax=Aurantimonas sp. A2-1-M11 TaxID=3113712 RepID=UPI002F95BF75